MSKETLEIVSKPLLPEEDLRDWYNKSYQRAKDASH